MFGLRIVRDGAEGKIQTNGLVGGRRIHREQRSSGESGTVHKHKKKETAGLVLRTTAKQTLLTPLVRDGAEGKIQTNGLLTSHHHEMKSERNNRKIIIGKAVKRSRSENRLRSRESRKERTYIGSQDRPLQKEKLIVALQN